MTLSSPLNVASQGEQGGGASLPDVVPHAPRQVNPRLAVPVESLRRFFSKVAPSASDCWEWTGTINGSGYGTCSPGFSAPSWMAHRLAYEWFVGPLDADLQIDHLCRNKLCVNPRHLEAVTPTVNMQRAVVARGPYCRNGHLLDASTLRIWSTGGGKTCRYCLVCRRASRARVKARSL